MNALDHIAIIAPSLAEGVAHVRESLDIDVPFGTRHPYMGTHNHRLQLGDDVYLEIVARDPDGPDPRRSRWFGLDDRTQVRADWEAGRRLRGWVARTEELDRILAAYPHVFGEAVALPPQKPEFAFSIPQDGTLPLGGAAPSFIDHRGAPTSMAEIPDRGARLVSFRLEHPDPTAVSALYRAIDIHRCPTIHSASALRYAAEIETPSGLRVLS
ncbi:MAG: VOC family protein [Alphaproteobacteria bacterium]|nr:VOC family protein [Alphaproteobacteria bacterium]